MGWRGWFSDTNKARTRLVLLFLLLGPAAYWTFLRLTVPVGYPACVRAPAACDGDALVLSLFRVDRIDGPERYVVEKGFSYVPIEGPTEGLSVGADISVGGAFRAEDLVVVASWRELHVLRTRKKVLGLVGLALLGVAAPFLVRRTPTGWVLRA